MNIELTWRYDSGVVRSGSVEMERLLAGYEMRKNSDQVLTWTTEVYYKGKKFNIPRNVTNKFYYESIFAFVTNVDRKLKLEAL